MTVSVLPNDRVRNLTRSLQAGSGVSMSPFTAREQVVDWGGARWVYSFEIGPFEGEQGRAYDAVLQGLQGRVGTFTMVDPTAERSDYTLGSPLVASAGLAG